MELYLYLLGTIYTMFTEATPPKIAKTLVTLGKMIETKQTVA